MQPPYKVDCFLDIVLEWLNLLVENVFGRLSSLDFLNYNHFSEVVIPLRIDFLEPSPVEIVQLFLLFSLKGL